MWLTGQQNLERESPCCVLRAFWGRLLGQEGRTLVVRILNFAWSPLIPFFSLHLSLPCSNSIWDWSPEPPPTPHLYFWSLCCPHTTASCLWTLGSSTPGNSLSCSSLNQLTPSTHMHLLRQTPCRLLVLSLYDSILVLLLSRHKSNVHHLFAPNAPEIPQYHLHHAAPSTEAGTH